MSDTDMVYIGRRAGEAGASCICVDKPEWAKDTAKTIGKWIRQGKTVERVTRDVGVAELKKWVRPKASAEAGGGVDADSVDAR